GYKLQLPIDVVVSATKVIAAAARGHLVDRCSERLKLLRLVHRTLNREADVFHVAADAGRRLADLDLRLGGRVLRLDHFLLRPERLDPRRERLLPLDELLLLRLEVLALLHDRAELALDRRLASERLAGEILAVRLDGVARLPVDLPD